ncbi:Ribokinase-like protein [Lipomyces japonicus]|uniref:Ribokinase-like protein n=1 Tax=Lipomyces japonicus TaxID=56871 RepID=UPI0034CE0C27
MTDSVDSLKRVLSIQSHVVHGYVGNRAATFPLQVLYWDVDVLNTVSFSNHTGYTQIKGIRHSAQDIRDWFDGLQMNTLTDYDAVLTGYIPGAEAVAEVGKVVRNLRQLNPALIWILDPVMGDENKLYVSPDVIPVYESLLPLATVITPNQFEAELLSGLDGQFQQKSDIDLALDKIYEKYAVPHIVISSIVLPSNKDRSEFICAGQTIAPDGSKVKFYLTLPFIDAYFTGTGDLFAAIMTDRFHHYTAIKTASNSNSLQSWVKSELPFVRAVEDVSAIVQNVLINTARLTNAYNQAEEQKVADSHGSYARPAIGTKERRIMDMKHSELRLIQSQDQIRNANVNVKAVFSL